MPQRVDMARSCPVGRREVYHWLLFQPERSIEDAQQLLLGIVRRMGGR